MKDISCIDKTIGFCSILSDPNPLRTITALVLSILLPLAGCALTFALYPHIGDQALFFPLAGVFCTLVLDGLLLCGHSLRKSISQEEEILQFSSEEFLS